METLKRHHETMYQVMTYLAEKWHIGVFTGVMAWITTSMNILFTDDTLRIAGGIGIYLAIFVSFLTAFMKLLDAYDAIRKRFRK